MIKRFPIYQQLDENDCGAVCLRMVARFHGRHYSTETLRENSYVGRQGATLLNISDAAERIGMQTLGIESTYQQLVEEVSLPCIAQWDQDHFVVIYRATPKQISIANPDGGIFHYKKEAFLSHWSEDGDESGIILLLEPTPEFYEHEGEAIDKSRFTYVFSYFRKYRYLITQLALGLLLGSVLQIIFPFLVKALIDVGIGNIDPSFIMLIILAQAVLFFTQTGIELLRRWILLHVGARVNINLISDFLMKLTRLPARFFDAHVTGDLMRRVADHDRIQRFLTGTTLSSTFSLVNFVAFSVVLLLWSKTIFLIFLAGTMLNLVWVFFFQDKRRDIDYRLYEQTADNYNRLEELIHGMQDIKLHQAEKQKRWAWERTQARLYRTNMKGLSLDQLQRSGASILSESKNLLITFVAATAVLQGSMTLGMLVAIHYILGQLNQPIAQFVDFMRAYQGARISLERMSEVHSRPDERDEEGKITILPEQSDLVLKNVTFRYSGPESPVILRNINLRIPQGKTTAIMGSSGSGKTTLLKLLMGFYEPTEGEVLVGGINLHNLSNRLWRNHCGMVLQEGFIFEDTIAKNIALGDEIIDERKLVKAVRVANLQPFVSGLPSGFNTQIGRGGQGLSKGQKQRLLIARAVYKDPDYIFFDEATTSLDAFNEVVIMENLEEFFHGKTIIIVAHRASTIAAADNIVVLESGEIIEQGTHEELRYLHGAYYQIMRNQNELGA